MQPIYKIIELLAFAALIILFAINGAYMLISPRAWLRSRWLANKNIGFREKYRDPGNHAELRILGAIFLGGIVWMGYNVLFGRR